MPIEQHETPILQATNDPLPPNPLLLPRTFTSDTVSTFIKVLTQNGMPINPTYFTHIANLKTYQQALQAFPLIQHHPKFQQLHKQVHAYFHLKANPPRHPNGKLQIHSFTKQYEISKSTVHNWINDIRRPHLLRLLETRATTLKHYQDRVTTIRETHHNLTTIHDLLHHLSSTHFMFAEKLQADPLFTDHITNATKYLNILQLVEAGYHPRDLEIHFHLSKDYIGDLLRYHHRPYLIKLATNIHTKPPPARTKWLPTTTDPSNILTRYITAPTQITNWHQIIPILNQLPSLNQPDEHLTRHLQQFGPHPHHLHQWKTEFGEIITPRDRLLALGYLIGTSLSDGWITQQSTYSSTFGLELSKKYPWAPTYGNRTAYYWTTLGFPTKPGKGSPIGPKAPHGKHNWYSITTPFFTWFNEAVLGFQPGQTHTDTPAKINWVLKAPKAFQIKVLQGLFDGDGWVPNNLKEIGIHSHQNCTVIKQLLVSQAIHPIEQKLYELVIRSDEGISRASELPIFLSASGRQKLAKMAKKMSDAPRSSTHLYDHSVMNRVLELHKKGVSKNRIRVQLLEGFNIVLSDRAINRILRKGLEGIRPDPIIVKTFFLFLGERIKNPNASLYPLARKIKKQTGFQGSLTAMYGWIKDQKIPRDVKIALSNDYPVEPKLMETYSHLKRYQNKN